MLFSKKTHLKTEMKNSEINTVNETDVTKKEVPAASAEKLERISSEDGRFELSYTADGVFLKLILPKGQGKKVVESECLDYLKRKGFFYIPVADIAALFESEKEDAIKISELIDEKVLDEEMIVEIENGKMAAYIKLLPPDPGGQLLTKEKIIEFLLQKYDISFGIDEEAIDALVRQKQYEEKILVAKGKPPVNGQNGELKFHFSVQENADKVLDISDDGKVDFRNISSIQSVTQGQLLVTRSFARAGEDGMDIQSKELRSMRGKEVALPLGKNTLISEDKLTLTAKVSGTVAIINGRVEVSPLYSIKGNVDMSVGNINTEGDVLVIGNVNSGFTVKTTGNITVNGIVEDAFLESGKDIVLKRGIQGADKGTLKAGGSIYALFIQRASAESEGNICADFIFHSKVKCEGNMELLGKNGLLVGGSADVGKSLVARTIGADSGILTSVKLGVSPKIRERLDEMDEKLKQIRSDIRRMEIALKSTVNKMSGDFNAGARLELTKKMLSMKREEVDMINEYNTSAAELEKAKEGSISVLNMAYCGVKIMIGAAQYTVKDEEVYVTYQNREGIIDVQPCKYVIQQGSRNRTE